LFVRSAFSEAVPIAEVCSGYLVQLLRFDSMSKWFLKTKEFILSSDFFGIGSALPGFCRA
jgi:hypothetical protein